MGYCGWLWGREFAGSREHGCDFKLLDETLVGGSLMVSEVQAALEATRFYYLADAVVV